MIRLLAAALEDVADDGIPEDFIPSEDTGRITGNTETALRPRGVS